MVIFVTGGTGVIGVAAVNTLLERGHRVRLFSRHASTEARQFTCEIEAIDGNVTDPVSIGGAMADCDCVLHIAGIVKEEPPELTFQNVNIQGTINLLAEAESAGVRKFVYMSSLGAADGASKYHASKRIAESHVENYSREWLIIRPAVVYGPGDEVVSLLLRMVRTLPAVPVIDGGDVASQPIWTGDLARVCVASIEREDLTGQLFEVAGEEAITMNQMLDRLAALTDKRPMRIPIPSWLAQGGNEALKRAGFDTGFSKDQITMLTEGNTISAGQTNALTTVFGIESTPLEQGLRELLTCQAEQLPHEGTGRLHYRRTGACYAVAWTAEELFEFVTSRFASFFPAGISGNPEPRDEEFRLGATLTLELPFRGTVQVRVAEMHGTSATCITLAGHPLAGVLNISTRDSDNGPVLEIKSYEKPATLADRVTMATVGRPLQSFTWAAFVANVGDAIPAPLFGQAVAEERDLSTDEAEPIERSIQKLALESKRENGSQGYLG